MAVELPGTNVPLFPHKKQVLSLVVLVVLVIVGLEVTGLGPMLQGWAAKAVAKVKGLLPGSKS